MDTSDHEKTTDGVDPLVRGLHKKKAVCQMCRAVMLIYHTVLETRGMAHSANTFPSLSSPCLRASVSPWWFLPFLPRSRCLMNPADPPWWRCRLSPGPA